MKKVILLTIFNIISAVFLTANAAVIEGSVAMTDRVPNELYGDWRVVATLVKSTNQNMFDTKSLDIWTLSRQGDIITLRNPLSGAKADITVNDVKGKTVKFEKRSSYPDEVSIETPILTINGDYFTGVDRINIKTFKDGKLIKEDYVEYQVRGTKISGMGIADILGI